MTPALVPLDQARLELGIGRNVAYLLAKEQDDEWDANGWERVPTWEPRPR